MDDEGYARTWYDQIGDDGQRNQFSFQVPNQKGSIIVSVETYSYDIIPEECLKGLNNLPQKQIEVYKVGMG